VAKQADYAIGSCLFLAATFLFIWIASRKQPRSAMAEHDNGVGAPSFRIRNVWFKCAAFASVVVAALSLPSSALNIARTSAPSLESLAARMPKQIGDFNLARTWYEQQSGTPVVQAGAYSAPGSDEIVLAVWIAPLTYYHDADSCWLARGLKPDSLSTQPFTVAGGNLFDLSTGFYNDGVTDSIVVNVACTPATCSRFQNVASTGHMGFVFLQPQFDAIAGKEQHPVSIMIRIDRVHTNEARAATQGLLLAEARQFLAGFNPTGISQSFQ
jgi:exosortase J